MESSMAALQTVRHQAEDAADGTIAAGQPGQRFDALALLSRQGALRTGGSLRAMLSKYHGIEGLLAMNGGLPPSDAFALVSLQLGFGGGGGQGSMDLNREQLFAAQQYNISAAGYPPLHQWISAHVDELHAPPAQHRVVVTGGSSQGVELVCSLFLDDGDCVLVDEYTFPQTLECNLFPRRCQALPVPLDHAGIVPEQLEQVLKDAAARGLPKPKLLYTIPTGQNPTGICTPLERKQAVYDICRRHGLLILEDDAYFYLQFPQGPRSTPGLDGLPRGSSYLSLDTDGRVVRLDTCAKFLAPGLRLGWAVAAPALADKITDALQAQTLGPAGISQVVAYRLLDSWGRQGLHNHLRTLQATYATRAAALQQAAQRELAGLAEWQDPCGGMFLWMKLLGVEDSSGLLDNMADARLMVVPGRVCSPRAADPAFNCPYIRISFSLLAPEQLAEGMRRLGAMLRSRQQASGNAQQQLGQV